MKNNKITAYKDNYIIMDTLGVFLPRGARVKITVISTDNLATLLLNKPGYTKMFYMRCVKRAITRGKDPKIYFYAEKLNQIHVKHKGLNKDEVREFYIKQFDLLKDQQKDKSREMVKK